MFFKETENLRCLMRKAESNSYYATGRRAYN